MQPKQVAPAGTPRAGAQPAATPDSTGAKPPATPVVTVDRSRFAPVGRSKTPIVAAVLAYTGSVVAVLEQSGRVTYWDVDMHQRLGSFASGVVPTADFIPPMELTPPIDLGVTWSQPFLAIGARDGSVAMWRDYSGEKVFTASSPGGLPIVDLHHIPHTPVLAGVASDGSLVRWMHVMHPDSALQPSQPHPGGAVYDLASHREAAGAFAAAAEGLYMVEGPMGFWKLVDSSSVGHPVRVVYSPSGLHVASAWSNGEIRIHTVATGVRARTIRSADGPPKLLAFNRDATLLAGSGSGRTIHVWSLDDDRPPVRIRSPRAPIQSMWFAPYDGSLVVAARGDRYLRRLEVPRER